MQCSKMKYCISFLNFFGYFICALNQTGDVENILTIFLNFVSMSFSLNNLVAESDWRINGYDVVNNMLFGT